MKERVVLVHGLWMNALAMYPLHVRIAKCGYDVDRFHYPSVDSGLEQHATRLTRFLSGLRANVIHLIGHSLGGVIVLHALRNSPDPRVRRAVLLGSPVAGSTSGRSLDRSTAGKWLLGRTSQIWSSRETPLAPSAVQVGVIAGSLPVGFGRLVTRLPKPNDGVVTLAETRVDGASDSIVLKVSHTQMLFSRLVAQQVCAFLQDAHFDHH